MNLIRWILSNIILIIFVLALTYAYVYWDNLTGEDTPAGKVIAWMSEEFEFVNDLIEEYRPQETETAPTTDVAVADTAAPAETQQPASQAQKPAVPSAKPAERESSRGVEPAPENASMPITSAAEPEPMRAAPASRADMAQRGMAPAPGPQYAPPSAAERPDRMAARPPRPERPEPFARSSSRDQAGKPDAGPRSTRDLWIDARKAFQDRDYKTAVRHYREVIARTEDNFDAWGELGNVYYREREGKQAAAAYYEAAAILVKQGQLRRASSLLPVLARLDSDKSKQLQELIENTGNR